MAGFPAFATRGSSNRRSIGRGPYAYADAPDLAVLAAAYGYGLARNHPFADGNKRASLVATETFLVLNGFELDVGNAEIVAVWEELAAGGIAEEDLAAWVRTHMVPTG